MASVKDGPAMDVMQALREKIDSLPAGLYSPGLKAVQLHVEAAIRHYKRAHAESDQLLFTDAIYRCNQAFEGSIKEAYRVLSKKSPEKKSIAEIEEFLSSGKVLRQKVLSQFGNYRKEWRNPSTHNYMLDFDGDEALLAIVSVAVFATVLCNQIQGSLAFEAAEKLPAGGDEEVERAYSGGPLVDVVANEVVLFCNHFARNQSAEVALEKYFNLFTGNLAGFIQSYFGNDPDINVMFNGVLDDDTESDIFIELEGGKVVIEIKLSKFPRRLNNLYEAAIITAADFLSKSDVIAVILVMFAPAKSDFEVSKPEGTLWKERLWLVGPGKKE